MFSEDCMRSREMVRLNFHEDKAVQVAGHLFKLAQSSSMDKLKLVKLLYLIDRASFEERERPIIGGLYFSMPHGPVTSEILESMNFGATVNRFLWDEHFESDGHHTITMMKDPGEGLLSRRELRIIDHTYEQFGRMATFALRDYTHELDEWEDPKGSSIEISIERLLLATGHSLNDAKRIVLELNGLQVLSSMTV